MTRVVFWQNLLTFYQVPHITALAATPGYDVVWVVEQLLDATRAADGWKVPHVENVTVVVAPDLAKIRELVLERSKESIHIFGGIHQQALSRTAFALCTKTPARIGLLNEPPIPGNAVRNLIVPPYHYAHRILYGHRIDFILGIGNMSVDFYRSVGYRQDIIFPYGYFPDLETSPTFDRLPGAPVKLMYLGQLIKRKGIDYLLLALAELQTFDWRLTIMGNGIEEASLKGMAKSLGLGSRIDFKAASDNASALGEIAKNDIFVLPSRHDGWGAVINEALMCGVPVVCSDRCGASALLGDPSRGETFKSGSAGDLTNVLRRWIENGPRTKRQFHTIQAWCEVIKGKSVGAYLASVLAYAATNRAVTGSRPAAPWLS